jgi:hypothetical protein
MWRARHEGQAALSRGAWAVGEAFFKEATDISQRAMLLGIAESIQLPVAEIRELLEGAPASPGAEGESCLRRWATLAPCSERFGDWSMAGVGVGDNALHHQECPEYPRAADDRKDDPLSDAHRAIPRTAARVTRTGSVAADASPHQAPTPEQCAPCERGADPKLPPNIVEGWAAHIRDSWPKSSGARALGNEQIPEHSNVIGSWHDDLRGAFAVKARELCRALATSVC